MWESSLDQPAVAKSWPTGNVLDWPADRGPKPDTFNLCPASGQQMGRFRLDSTSFASPSHVVRWANQSPLWSLTMCQVGLAPSQRSSFDSSTVFPSQMWNSPRLPSKLVSSHFLPLPYLRCTAEAFDKTDKARKNKKRKSLIKLATLAAFCPTFFQCYIRQVILT
jgi:hypothetical protein